MMAASEFSRSGQAEAMEKESQFDLSSKLTAVCQHQWMISLAVKLAEVGYARILCSSSLSC